MNSIIPISQGWSIVEINCIGPDQPGCDRKFHHSSVRQPWTCSFNLSGLQILTCKMGMAEPAMHSSYENKGMLCIKLLEEYVARIKHAKKKKKPKQNKQTKTKKIRQ